MTKKKDDKEFKIRVGKPRIRKVRGAKSKRMQLAQKLGSIQASNDGTHRLEAQDMGGKTAPHTVVSDRRRLYRPRRGEGGKGTQSARRSEWIPPDDMPEWQKILVCGERMCGGKLTNTVAEDGSTLYCRRRPYKAAMIAETTVPPYRCQSHGGGRAAQAAGTSRKADASLFSGTFKHGFWIDGILPGEEKLFEQLCTEGPNLTLLIANCVLRIKRAQRQKQLQQTLIDEERSTEAMQLYEMVTEKGIGAQGPIDRKKRTRKMVDWDLRIHGVSRELTDLLKTQAIVSGDTGNDPRSIASKVRELLAISVHSLDPDADKEES